jgi:hypothetical protein
MSGIAPNTAIVAGWGDKPPGRPVRASDLKVIGKGMLKAIVNITVPKWRLVIRACLWCERDGKGWISFPSRERTDRKDAWKFGKVVEAIDRQTASRLQNAPLAAVRAIGGTGRL